MSTGTTVRWKRIDLDHIDDICLETDEVIERYRQVILNSGADSEAAAKLRQSIDVRCLQLQRSIEKNGEDKRVNLLEMQRMKLQRLLEGDIPEIRRLPYEQDSAAKFDTTEDVRYRFENTRFESSRLDDGPSATQQRLAERQQELQDQQQVLDAQRLKLLEQERERHRRAVARASFGSEQGILGAKSPRSTVTAQRSPMTSPRDSPSHARGESPFQAEQLREQERLLEEQRGMLARLQDQQAIMQRDFGEYNGDAPDEFLALLRNGADTQGYPFFTRQSPPADQAALPIQSLRKRGRMVVREYLITLTPEQHDELVARRKQLAEMNSPLVPFAVFPYLKKKTGHASHTPREKRQELSKLDSYESMYMRSQGPYVDPSWLDTYMRKQDKKKWVDPERGFRSVINTSAQIDSPERSGKLPLYLDQSEL